MLKNIVIFIIALLGFGMIRLPLQERILEQEKNAGLLEEPVSLSSSDYLDSSLPWCLWAACAPWWRRC